jgi:hypothetical protein
MLNDLSRARLIGAWCMTVMTIGACSIVAGADITIGNGEWLLMACLVPPAVMLLVWRGAPPVTVAELL